VLAKGNPDTARRFSERLDRRRTCDIRTRNTYWEISLAPCPFYRLRIRTLKIYEPLKGIRESISIRMHNNGHYADLSLVIMYGLYLLGLTPENAEREVQLRRVLREERELFYTRRETVNVRFSGNRGV
jgi:hypothetical protein